MKTLKERLADARRAIIGGEHACRLHDCTVTAAQLLLARDAVREAEELLDAIAKCLDGELWSSETTTEIAECLFECGYQIGEPL